MPKKAHFEFCCSNTLKDLFLRLGMEAMGRFSPRRAAVLAIGQPETAGLPAIQRELKRIFCN